MSSLLTIIEKDKITFACDTASCKVWCKSNEETTFYRNRDEVVDKIIKVGKDVVFVSGTTNITNIIKPLLSTFVDADNHINLNMLSMFLKNNLTEKFISEAFKVSTDTAKEMGLGLTVLRQHGDTFEAIQLHNAYEYDLQVVRPERGSLRVAMFGFDCEEIIESSKPIFSKCRKHSDYRSPDLFYQVYQNNYRECVGGCIRVYRFDKTGCTLLDERKLIENNLKYEDDLKTELPAFDILMVATSGVIAGLEIVPEDPTTHDGGFLYDDGINKYIRISPYSSRDGLGGFDENYGAIDLGSYSDEGVSKTLIHLRSDGYARFGLVSESGASIRFNDYLRGEKGTDTVLYSQNFQINRDGTVNIKSNDVTKPISQMAVTETNGLISQLDITYNDSTTATLGVEYNASGKVSKIGDTIISY